MKSAEHLAFELQSLKKNHSTYDQNLAEVCYRARQHLAACDQLSAIYVKKCLKWNAKAPLMLGELSHLKKFVELLHQFFENLVYSMSLKLVLEQYYHEILNELLEGKLDCVLNNDLMFNFFQDKVLRSKNLTEAVSLATDELREFILERLSDSVVKGLWQFFYHLDVVNFLAFCECVMISPEQVTAEEKDEIICAYFTSISRTIKLFQESLDHVVRLRRINVDSINPLHLSNYDRAPDHYKGLAEWVVNEGLKPPDLRDFAALFARESMQGEYRVEEFSLSDEELEEERRRSVDQHPLDIFKSTMEPEPKGSKFAILVFKFQQQLSRRSSGKSSIERVSSKRSSTTSANP